MVSDKMKLYQALETLQPRNVTDIHVDHLDTFLKDVFASAEVIVNSVPIPAQSKSDSDSDSSSSFTSAKLATNAASLTASTYPPPTLHPEHEELKPYWGKPLKLGTNPLGMSLYKMSPHDRHGAWFARRSIHQGLPFDKWKGAMKREFAESIGVVGGPGAGAIRGIGAEKRLERQVVKGVGKLEVYLLSAQFPGPTAPRDFVTCLLTSDEGLTDSSVPHNGAEKGNGSIPRHHMVISIPVDHPDAPPRTGLVRGQYESVEMIREIPIAEARERGFTGDNDSNGTSRTTDANPVEWIMITRSDPGGGLPRFMVERGTPGSIASDAVKFIDWATSRENFPEDDEENETMVDGVDEVSQPPLKPLSRTISDGTTFEPSGVNDTGVISALTSVVRGTLATYTPDAVQEGMARFLPGSNPSDTTLGQEGVDDDDDDDSTETSSIDSFASAEQFTTAPDHMPAHLRVEQNVLSSASSIDRASMDSGKDSDKTHLEKKLAKIETHREKLETEFKKAQERSETKSKDIDSKESKDSIKLRERIEKDRKRQEEKHTKSMQKLEQKIAYEHRKAAERAKKASQSDEITKLKRERDQARRMAEVRRKEAEVTRERLGELQRENTLIIAKVIDLEGGPQVIQEVREEMRKSP